MNSTSGSGALICLRQSWPPRDIVKELRAGTAQRRSGGGGGGAGKAEDSRGKKNPSEAAAAVEGLLLISASHYPSSVARAAGRPVSSAVWDASRSSADNWP